MSTITADEHFLVRHPYAGTGGDRPTPAEVTYTCGGCGEELWTAEEGGMASPGTALEALDEHLADVAVEGLARQLRADGWPTLGGCDEPDRFDACDICADAARTLARFLIDHDYVDAEL